MLRRLKNFQEKFEFVGDVRGRGLMMGIEFVKSKKTKEPLSKEVCLKIFQECLKRGLLSMSYTYTFRLIPPLTILKKEALEAFDILEETFTALSKKGNYK